MIDVSLDDKLYFQVNMNEGFCFGTTFWNPTITYEDSTICQASEGFSDIQEQGQWHYQYWDSKNYMNMVCDQSFKIWRGKNAPNIPSITSDRQHPSEGLDTARVFVVPKDGTISLIGAPSALGTPY